MIKVKLGLACQKSTLREKLFKGGRQKEMIDRQESEKKHLEGRKNVTKIAGVIKRELEREREKEREGTRERNMRQRKRGKKRDRERNEKD